MKKMLFDKASFDKIRASGVARGAGGGHLPPGAARRGAPKSCQRLKKNYIRRNFINSERTNENVVIFFFDYILDFSAPPPPSPHKVITTIFLYI